MIPNCKKQYLQDFYTDKFMEHTLLFEGAVDVPSRQSGNSININLNDDIGNFDYLIVERTYGEICEMQPIRKKNDGVHTCRFYFQTTSDWGTENVNMYSLWISKSGLNKISASFNVSTVIQTDGNIGIDLNYILQPITKIIGIKLVERTYTEKVLKQTMLDFCYPVGSYYETSNTNFDPNIELGGTWVQDTKGLVTSGAYQLTDTDPGNSRLYLHAGSIRGETTHQLSTAEMPYHEGHFGQGLSGNFKGKYLSIHSSAWSESGEYARGWDIVMGNEVQPHSKASGEDISHNNTQPTIGVIRWHRIS